MLSMSSITSSEKRYGRDLFAVFLLGISTVQMTIFFQTNKRIPYLNKLAVFLLWLLNCLHVAVTTHITYHYLVTMGGNIQGPLVWSYTASSILELSLTNITQMLYSIRLWQLLKRNKSRPYLFSLLVMLLMLSIAMNIYIPIQIAKVKNIISLGFVTYHWAVTLDFSTSSAIDFLLSTSLIYSLAKFGKRLEWAETTLTVLAAYALNTGIIASFFSLTCIMAYVLMPKDLIFFALKIVLTGLYVNSFLAMLNARFYFQRSEGLVNVSLPQVIMYEHGGGGQARASRYDHRSLGPPRAPRMTQTEDTHNATINEAGLPLFNSKHASDEPTANSIQLLEVKVTKEELQAHDL